MNYKNLTFWLMISFIIGLGIYLIYFINTESYSCMSSPLTYGVSKFKTDLGQVICYCNIEEENCECSIPLSTDKIIVTKYNISIDTLEPFFVNPKWES